MHTGRQAAAGAQVAHLPEMVGSTEQLPSHLCRRMAIGHCCLHVVCSTPQAYAGEHVLKRGAMVEGAAADAVLAARVLRAAAVVLHCRLQAARSLPFRECSRIRTHASAHPRANFSRPLASSHLPLPSSAPGSALSTQACAALAECVPISLVTAAGCHLWHPVLAAVVLPPSARRDQSLLRPA